VKNNTNFCQEKINLIKKFLKNLKIKKFVFFTIFLTFIYFLPFFFFKLKYQNKIFTSIDNLPNSDAVIIFGTLIKNEEFSPLLEERLLAGKIIYEKNKAKKIVVSNTEKASQIMVNYYKESVDFNLIEIDNKAEKTPDSCRFEKEKYPKNREIIFVSQNFHLPRLIYQCEKVGVKGVGFAPEKLNLIDRSQQSFLLKICIRTQRYLRETGLFWLAILGIYE
jgi:vancomycin permeability regulator SanA